MKRDCPSASPECYYAPNCYSDLHHQYWYSYDYKTPLEKKFRELPQNKEQICRAEHDEIHATQEPPVKPSIDEMVDTIVESGVNISRSVRKAIRGQ